MALTKFQIDEIKKRAKDQGMTDEQVEAGMSQLVSQFDSNQGIQQTPQISAPTPTTSTTPTTQPAQQVMGASSPMASTPQQKVATPQQSQQPQNASLVGGFFKSLYNTVVNPAVEYGKFVGEAGAQAVRFASDPAFRKAATGRVDQMTDEELKRFGSEKATYFVDEEKVKDAGSIVKTGVKATLADEALFCVVKGTGVALEHLDVYKKTVLSKK